jgi:hypothetical protein
VRASTPLLGRKARYTLRLGLVLGVLVGVNVYVFLLRRGTSLGAVLQTAAATGAPPPETPPASAQASAVLSAPSGRGVTSRAKAPTHSTPAAPAPVSPRTLQAQVAAGSSLRATLTELGVAADESLAVAHALTHAFPKTQSYAGASFVGTLDARGHLATLSVHPPSRTSLLLTRDRTGAYAVAAQ